ncbi:MAG: DUF1553 domain-containing protein [Gemmataceae bacterium]|nr:DUF1553 domain-containing protein [Gemmata sp.]MDW8196092.1 DUF1553 domain-containing protein [Gemmataceae bacterium]
MRWLLRVSVIALIGIVLTPWATAADPLPEDWAFHPFQRPTPPRLDNPSAAIRNPIDRFLLAKLAEHNLTYAPEADRHTLIRRLYYDLIGLPPTPEEVAAFVRDSSPEAYEKLVDKLLASPRFGERQALWWLDLVRFAETDGFNADGVRPHAWRYRDYVINSFNADKPFDRFIREQIAGDELYPDDHDAWIATGFLRHYPDEYNAVNLEQRRYEIITDITDTTAATFLGLTAGCARCHDHKYDPVTQDDYFRMQAFFAGFWPVEKTLFTPAEQAEYEKRLAAWEAKTAHIRQAIAKIEEPHRKKESQRQRQRFPEEYAKLLDIPFENRTPWEKQIAAMVEKQVYSEAKDVSKNIKGAEKEQYEALKAQLAAFEKDKPADPPQAMVMTDLPESPPTYLFKRGEWRKPGPQVVPGYIHVITPHDADPKPLHGSPGRRAALANWIASKDNPLTARVIVNRLWQHHFGFGIVRTSSDFGVAGDQPTHPELLDWLASELVNPTPPTPDSTPPPAWSLKHIHRLIVTSAAYRQGSRGHQPAAAEIDPENHLLWHFPRRRLDGETLRDAMLAVSGQLNLKVGGPSIFPELPAELQKTTPAWKPTPDAQERNRRSIYVFVKRNLRYPLFLLFDAPDRNETCSRRFATTTAPQALMLLNDSVVLGFAKAFAARVTQDVGTDFGKVIERAFQLAIHRPPTADERHAMRTFLERHPGPPSEAVVDLCHALLNINEFLYID